jgi:hypothetical protein
MDIKIDPNKIRRTNLSHPSVLEYSLPDGHLVCIWYRYGKFKVVVSKEPLETWKRTDDKMFDPEYFAFLYNGGNPVDDFDIGGYLSDELLLKVLMKLDMVDGTA